MVQEIEKKMLKEKALAQNLQNEVAYTRQQYNHIVEQIEEHDATATISVSDYGFRKH